MKKFLLLSLVTLSSFALMSWGVIGHKTIAQIAENHLNLQAKGAVKALLGNQSLADVATWADEVRNQQEYRKTASWHFLNVPLGLNYNQFIQAIKDQPNDNVYTALIKCQQELSEVNTTTEKKAIALKFIVHFVGDLHQPMHISRAEDKGGNTIQVRFDNKGTNLHSLWDSKLLEYQPVSYNQLANSYDVATSKQIKEWQSDDVLKWIFESYLISSQLYAEVEGNVNIEEQYYKHHIFMIQQRLQKGGIRLAGLLNNSLKSINNVPQIVPSATSLNNLSSSILISDIKNHIGEVVTVSTKMYGFKALENMTLLNMGADYPNQLLTVVLEGKLKNEYKNLGSKKLTITGKVLEYRGKVEIEVTTLEQIKISL